MIKGTKFFHEFLRHEFVPGANICKLTGYNDISFWWFADNLFYNVAVSLSKGDCLKARYYKKVSTVYYKSIGIYADIILDSILVIILWIFNSVWHILNKSGSSSKNNVKIMITTGDGRWRSLDYGNSLNSKKSDVFFHPIIEKLKDEVKVVGTYPISIPNVFVGLKTFLEKIFFWDVEYCPYNMYWSINVWKEEYLAHKHFNNVWDTIKLDDITKMCNKHNLPSDLVIDELDFYFHVLFPLEAKYLALIRRMIKHKNPDLFLVINEYNWRERPLIIAAKAELVPTLAMQHGVIHPFHRGYIYDNNEISGENQTHLPYCPIPDMTALYGEYHKDLLTKTSSYPQDRVTVTGQPRYDILSILMKEVSSEAIRAKYFQNNDFINILWTTQCHGLTIEENIQNFNAVFSAVAELDNVNLIIKQHPGEGNKYTDLINESLKNYSINVQICPKDSNILELLYACDLVITKSSTTGLEGVALNKPLIILNLSGDPDPVDYVDQGVALGVYDADDLKSTILLLLNDDSILAKNRKRFVERNLYAVDGQATERVIQCAISMIKRKTHQKR